MQGAKSNLTNAKVDIQRKLITLMQGWQPFCCLLFIIKIILDICYAPLSARKRTKMEQVIIDLLPCHYQTMRDCKYLVPTVK